MASGLVPQEEPFPWRGLNDAVSPVNLEPGFAQAAHDVVLDEPGAVRPRMGWLRGATFYTIDTAWAREVPVGYMYGPTGSGYTVLHTYVNRNTDVAGVGEWANRYIDGVNLRAFGYVTGLTGVDPPVAMPTDSLTYNLLPYGQPHWFVDRQFAVSVGTNFSRFMGHFSATTTVTDRNAIVIWKGNGSAVQTRTLTINNGSTTGTLSAAITGSAPGMYMIVTDTTAGEVAGHKYVYEVFSSGGVNITLTQPYGLGDSATDVPNIAGKTVTFMPIGYIPNAPDADCMAVWRERLWCVGGTLNQPPATTSPVSQANNVLLWSEVSDYNRWPVANYIQLDSSEGIKAMAATNEALFLFSARTTQVITGTDESNFQRVTLYNDLGCVHPNLCHSDGNSVFVCDAHGVYRLTLGARENLTQPDPTTGIPVAYRSWLMNSATNAHDAGFSNTSVPWLVTHRDQLFLTMDKVLGPTADATYLTSRPMGLVYNLRTGSWGTWGRTTTRSDNPGMLYKRRDIPTTDPAGNQVGEWRLWGAGRTGLFYLDHCWDNETLAASLTPVFIDQLHRDAGATATGFVEASFTSRDFMFADGLTTRIQDIQVEHGLNGTSAVLPWTVTLDYDQDIDSSSLTVGTVAARVVNPASRSRYYTDNFTGVAFPTEGMVFRTRYTFSGNAVLSGKLYRQRFKVLRQPTKGGRVDNT